MDRRHDAFRRPRRPRLPSEGFRPFLFDGHGEGAGVAEAVRLATHVVVSVPPGDDDPGARIATAPAIVAADEAPLDRLSLDGRRLRRLRRRVGERGDDAAPAARAVARATEAETAWREFAAERNVPLAIFRIAGIYGPGRNAFVNLDGRRGAPRRQAGAGVQPHPRRRSRRGACCRDCGRSADGIFNVADDEPAPPQDVVTFAAGLMGVEPPPEVPFAHGGSLADGAVVLRDEQARPERAGSREALGVALRYPTYREGLTALWRSGRWRG